MADDSHIYPGNGGRKYSSDAPAKLPNLWNLYNLRQSPYFQDTLGGEAEHHPLSLFVGRQSELESLVSTIGSGGSSRQVVGGRPGVGKTTLVQGAKAAAVGAGFWATDSLVSFYPEDTTELLLGRLLGGVYDAIVTARPHTAEQPAMQTAQQLVRVARLATGGLNLSAAGIGLGVSRGVAMATPAGALLLDGPRLVRELLELVLAAGARGIVLHLNNLEILSERDAAAAADILRSLRDPVLLQPGLHLILAGTTDAVTAVVTRHPQVRSVFASPLLLEPLPPTDVDALLAARYAHLRLEPEREPVAPIAPEAVAGLYAFFQGDLRGLFKSLEEGATLLMGVGASPGTPLALDDLRPVLQRRYEAELAAALEPVRAEQLRAWASAGVSVPQTQERLRGIWHLSQPATSNAVRDLIERGYAISLPRRGAAPIEYLLTGASRLIFG
jgi:AAA ATPase-like protein